MVIKWKTETPSLSGVYLTTREIRNTKKRYVSLDFWYGNDFIAPRKNMGWEANHYDNSEVKAWADCKDISPFKNK